MTLYYSMCFILLTAEMVFFLVLIAPLPFAIRRKFFTFLSESPIVGKIAYALKIMFIFVAILFVDAVQRMFRTTAEADLARLNQGGADVRAEANFAAKKFYAQRNMYLTGFTLFLSLVLTRTFYIILDLIHTQEEYAKLKKASQSGDQTAQLEELRAKLEQAEAKARDYDVLKSQATNQAKEYDRLADEYNAATSGKSDKKAD
ncbi:endoplasmic reticulum protein [Dacryopinax primogenitus]|uniref:Endoplasmic reticulum transmembrane protein n=1 Tax=Dacryopinax primogenitus (strain DJM 731) TaxID=1858805 RepID=M5G901_DACPD|nr:endoplasmic reticulum protein [Dacryopinax primogenitus]EJU00258.1 endoplasmic reticulum protein [Dacryopinax primogenitus]